MAKKKKEHITFDKMRSNRSSVNFIQANQKGKAPTFNKMHNTKKK